MSFANVDEAYDYAMEIVEELRATGITVTLKPTKSRNDPECVAKYSGPDRVRPERWFHVTFSSSTPQQSVAIREKQTQLGWLGIHFDSGGMVGKRDWEFDWSFKYVGAPDGNREQSVNQTNDLIDALESGTLEGIPMKPGQPGEGDQNEGDQNEGDQNEGPSAGHQNPS
jgi:hypothetical protein